MIDIKRIITDIKETSLKDHSKNTIPEFDIDKYFKKNSDEENLMLLFYRANIGYYRELNGNIITSFVKRVIRRLIRFCVMPCITDISYFNMRTAMVLMNMSYDLSKAEKDIQVLKEEIRNLKEKD